MHVYLHNWNKVDCPYLYHIPEQRLGVATPGVLALGDTPSQRFWSEPTRTEHLLEVIIVVEATPEYFMKNSSM